jgi:HK97 family phage prohead protease
MRKEYLIQSGAKLSLRENSEGKLIASGYAATYNTRSKLILEDNKRFYEEILPGAFETGLANSVNVIANIDHKRELMVAKRKSGTLNIEADDIGLRFEVELPDTQRGRDLAVQKERGDVSELSFAFLLRNKDFKWSRTEKGELLRKISDFYKITDIAFLQGEPAYPNTYMELATREYDEANASLLMEEQAREKELSEYYESLRADFYN